MNNKEVYQLLFVSNMHEDIKCGLTEEFLVVLNNIQSNVFLNLLCADYSNMEVVVHVCSGWLSAVRSGLIWSFLSWNVNLMISSDHSLGSLSPTWMLSMIWWKHFEQEVRKLNCLCCSISLFSSALLDLFVDDCLN